MIEAVGLRINVSRRDIGNSRHGEDFRKLIAEGLASEQGEGVVYRRDMVSTLERRELVRGSGHQARRDHGGKQPHGQQARERLNTVVEEVGAHYAACLRAGDRLHAPAALLRNMERARLALNLDELYERGDARTHLLHALSGLRLALLPGVEVMLEPAEQPQLPPGIDGAPL